MMDMVSELIPLLNQVGFPIFAFILMYKMANDGLKEVSSALRGVEKQLERIEGILDGGEGE